MPAPRMSTIVFHSFCLSSGIAETRLGCPPAPDRSTIPRSWSILFGFRMAPVLSAMRQRGRPRGTRAPLCTPTWLRTILNESDAAGSDAPRRLPPLFDSPHFVYGDRDSGSCRSAAPSPSSLYTPRRMGALSCPPSRETHPIRSLCFNPLQICCDCRHWGSFQRPRVKSGISTRAPARSRDRRVQ